MSLKKIPLATAKITNKTPGLSIFMSVHPATLLALPAPSTPHPPNLVARHQIWETRGGGGWALRAASHGLSDLLTPLGLRPQCLPTLVNKQAPFKAVSWWAAANPPGQVLSELGPPLKKREPVRRCPPLGIGGNGQLW